MSGFRKPLCLSNEDVLLIDSRNVLKRPQGKRYCAGGTASSCINQQASLRCSSPLRRVRPPVCQIPQHANQAFQEQFIRMGPCEVFGDVQFKLLVLTWTALVSSCCWGLLIFSSSAMYVGLKAKKKIKHIFFPAFVIALSHRFQMTRRSREDSWLNNSNSTRKRG